MIFALAVALLAQGLPAGAESSLDICLEGKAKPPEMVISACERSLSDPALTGAARSGVLNNIGLAHRRLGALDEALRYYELAIAADPALELPYNNRANLYSAQGRHALAVADYSRALEKNPELAEAWNGRCWSRLFVENAAGDALADCNEALRLRPNSPATLDSRGYAFLLRGEYDKALADFRTAAEALPSAASPRYGLGLAKVCAGIAGGDADLEAAKRMDPTVDETAPVTETTVECRRG
jgi:tetratricopeptide (TPR) repeat protein